MKHQLFLRKNEKYMKRMLTKTMKQFVDIWFTTNYQHFLFNVDNVDNFNVDNF